MKFSVTFHQENPLKLKINLNLTNQVNYTFKTVAWSKISHGYVKVHAGSWLIFVRFCSAKKQCLSQAV